MASKCTTCGHNIKVKVAIVLSLGGVRRADRPGGGGGVPVAEPKQPKKRPDATQATDDGATLRHANAAMRLVRQKITFKRASDLPALSTR